MAPARAKADGETDIFSASTPGAEALAQSTEELSGASRALVLSAERVYSVEQSEERCQYE